MISKELLSEVFDYEVVGMDIVNDGRNVEVRVQNNKYHWNAFNIYEVAYKIENWIESKDINVIRIKENNFYEFYINAYIDENYKVLVFEDSITSNIKIDGIFAVAEFILNKVSK